MIISTLGATSLSQSAELPTSRWQKKALYQKWVLSTPEGDFLLTAQLSTMGQKDIIASPICFWTMQLAVCLILSRDLLSLLKYICGCSPRADRLCLGLNQDSIYIPYTGSGWLLAFLCFSPPIVGIYPAKLCIGSTAPT